MTCKALTADDARNFDQNKFQPGGGHFDIQTRLVLSSVLLAGHRNCASFAREIMGTSVESDSNQRIGVKQNDSIKPSNELESQAASQGATGNGRSVHTCTCGIGHHVLGCSDIGRLIVAFATINPRFSDPIDIGLLGTNPL
jgi:hypothetical protein